MVVSFRAGPVWPCAMVVPRTMQLPRLPAAGPFAGASGFDGCVVYQLVALALQASVVLSFYQSRWSLRVSGVTDTNSIADRPIHRIVAPYGSDDWLPCDKAQGDENSCTRHACYFETADHIVFGWHHCRSRRRDCDRLDGSRLRMLPEEQAVSGMVAYHPGRRGSRPRGIVVLQKRRVKGLKERTGESWELVPFIIEVWIVHDSKTLALVVSVVFAFVEMPQIEALQRMGL